ncbi:hypothetical protein [Winogradskyella pulchriflava]|uniref:Peptidase M15C domain-containing protein n=1 Tax=Winogradskyella pulchriflava TaxID=1110688 RepID=A0ABV6QDE8_9FLAO
MSLSKIQREFTFDIAKLIIHAYECLGIEMTFGEAHRTNSQMLLNYFGYEVVKGGVFGIKLQKTRQLSKVLWSSHGDRLAVDFNFFIDGELTYDWHKIKPLADYWEDLREENVWGGDWNKNGIKDGFIDVPHFQRLKE